MIRSRQQRSGVTLVEMLVATAMCILGMWMLTWMFQQATASFTLANAQATLTAQERMVTTIMSRDLEANRFAPDDAYPAPSRGQRLSDYQPGRRSNGGYLLANSLPPGTSTFNVEEGDPSNNYFDSYGFGSSRSGTHRLQFTAVRPDEPGNRVTVEVPAQSGRTTAGTAIEVAYFLSPSGTSSTGAQLYDLIRVQRLVAHNDYDKADYENLVLKPVYEPTKTDNAEEVMAAIPPTPGPPMATPTTMFTLGNQANGLGRYTGSARTPSSKRYGEDRLLSNVLSMEVKYTGQTSQPQNMLDTGAYVEPWPTTNTAGPYGTPRNVGSPPVWPRPFDPVTIGGVNYTYRNSDYPYDFLPHDGVFDSGDPTGPPQIIGTVRKPTRTALKVTAVQIRVRVLFGTTARQTTIVVAL